MAVLLFVCILSYQNGINRGEYIADSYVYNK